MQFCLYQVGKKNSFKSIIVVAFIWEVQVQPKKFDDDWKSVEKKNKHENWLSYNLEKIEN